FSAQDQLPPAHRSGVFSSLLKCLQEPDLSIALANCHRSPLDLLQLLLTLSWMRSIAQDQLPPAHRSGVFSSLLKCLQVPDLSILPWLIATAHALLDAATAKYFKSYLYHTF
ncbi:hypothetical protein NST41_33505, partial [Paenibacillus sp. FSL L8-0696]|uniref:hypothetical protein n=1 Tax=Paenibacillus sp. FSL L8-0696 TaxID=2954524 RepID=UPI00311A4B3A